MALHIGNNEETAPPVQIYFTREQLDWMKKVSAGSRGAVVRYCVDVVRRREKISIDALKRQTERQTDPELKFGVEFATTMDFEIILDAYADLFAEPLKEAAVNGRNINGLVPTFMGLIEKNLNKSTSEQQVLRFLYEKMEESSVTNFQKGT